jgi:hypothetical protein
MADHDLIALAEQHGAEVETNASTGLTWVEFRLDEFEAFAAALSAQPQEASGCPACATCGQPWPDTCKRCGGTGVVDDGEITGIGGVPFENGPIKCVRDCPLCKAQAQPPSAQGECFQCEAKASDGWALYCTPCRDAYNHEQRADAACPLSVKDSPIDGKRAEPQGLTPEWATCESRGPMIRNSLKARIEDMKRSASHARNAFRKDFMNEPSQWYANAIDEARAVLERHYAAIAIERAVLAKNGLGGKQ